MMDMGGYFTVGLNGDGAVFIGNQIKQNSIAFAN